MAEELLARGELAFTVQARLLRELGERLVRRPEVALVELIKNAYDANANECRLGISPNNIEVADDGHGMTLDQFTHGWMAVGTGAKSQGSTTRGYGRAITGEKGIGRFSVRFLGRRLSLRSVADDPARGRRTLLTAEFHWPAFDAEEDLGQIKVPYELRSVQSDRGTGTTLAITELRHNVTSLDLGQVRTASFGLLSPLRSLIEVSSQDGNHDPGFRLLVAGATDEPEDVGVTVLDHFALRATLNLEGKSLALQIWTGADQTTAAFELVDTLDVECGDVRADLRFFPRREGMFRGIGVDGRKAHSWISENGGIAVFDRAFRISPYGESSDDWLQLDADNARNFRHPRSSLAAKHFPMSEAEQGSTSENWMLRLPQSRQIVGVVQVQGARQAAATATASTEGLVAAADREGFVVNDAFLQLVDLVRGAVEALAMVDRRQQQEAEKRKESERVSELQQGIEEALEDLDADPDIPRDRKRKLATAIRSLGDEAMAHEQVAQERTRQMEVMSLLGVVAGYMTHEFGVALEAIRRGKSELERLTPAQPALAMPAAELARSEGSLLEFLNYSRLYIRGATKVSVGPYVAAYRINRVKKIYGRYAEDRSIDVQVQVDPNLPGPGVPAALYDGIALNLYTNALKAVTAASRKSEARISFTAWNEKDEHVLEVSDTGVGIPSVLRERVFEPLFTTTASENDPLGSGLGLGLSLVRSGAQAFGGQVRVVPAVHPYSTCIQVRLPKGDALT